jgi:hypothetical protein
MDSVLKIVYSRWVNSIPLPNGLTNDLASWATKNLDKLDSRYFFNDPASSYYFRNSNFHLHCKNLVPLISESEIDDTGTYLYPIEIECNTIRYLINPQNNYNFIDTLSDTMIGYLKSGKVNLLLVNMIDPSIEPAVIQELEQFIHLHEIKKVILLQGNCWLNINTDIKMIDSIISLYQTANEMDRYPCNTPLGYESDFVRESDLTNMLRPKKFLSFNRFMDRPNRTGVAYLVLKYNLLPDGYFSFLCNSKDDYEDQLRLLDLPTEPFADAIREMVPRQIDTQHLDSAELPTFFTVTNYKKDLYQNSYIHIVTETQFESSATPFFSEKTWRPILNLQPFVYLGNPLSLNTLRTLGFKTFSPFINESYDLETDPVNRFALIDQEISRLGKLSVDEIHEWYTSIKEILLHNQKLLYSYKNYNPLCNLVNLN